MQIKRLQCLLLFGLIFSLGGGLLIGCTQPLMHGENKQKTSVAGFPCQITDFLGREVNIDKEPRRLVSLSPATTEILFALGAGERLVGITSFDDYPPEQIKSIPQVGDFQGPNIEAILAQKPDLIFASRLSGKEQMEILHRSGFTVVVLEAASLEQIFDSIKITATITNTALTAEKITAQMKDKINELHTKVQDLPPVKTFYLVDANGNWTAGKNTFIDELLSQAGGKNIAGETAGWVQYSLETVAKENPTVILTAPHAGKIEDICQMPGYKNTEAVRNGRVHTLSDDNLISRPSDRIVQGLEEITVLLHPEAFQ